MKKTLDLELSGFEQYLHNKGYRINTVRGLSNNIGLFTVWCNEEGIAAEKASYNDLLLFIKSRQEKGNVKHTIKTKILAIKHYYNFLMTAQQRQDNPAVELRIRNEVKRMPHNLLSKADLESIHQNFPSAGLTGKRNKIILGLMIYQGLNVAEIVALEVKDLKLEEGKIYVPSVARGNSRTLTLEAHQILQLQTYLLQIRPVILTVAEKHSEKLFTSTGKSNRLDGSIAKMMNTLQKLYPQVKDTKQIRASIITEWLKKHNIRQVQYLCGHRYVSSTERYRTDKLEGLQEQLENLHPIK